MGGLQSCRVLLLYFIAWHVASGSYRATRNKCSAGRGANVPPPARFNGPYSSPLRCQRLTRLQDVVRWHIAPLLPPHTPRVRTDACARPFCATRCGCRSPRSSSSAIVVLLSRLLRLWSRPPVVLLPGVPAAPAPLAAAWTRACAGAIPARTHGAFFWRDVAFGF